MELLQETPISCPYCGETVTVLVDTSVDEQEYIEDCQVCCRPIILRLSAPAMGKLTVDARREDDL